MILPAEQFWDRANRISVLLASIGMIVVIALVDWWTTPYVSLGFLYLVPSCSQPVFFLVPRLQPCPSFVRCSVRLLVHSNRQGESSA